MHASKSGEVFYFLAKESWFFLPQIGAAIHITLVNKNEKPWNRILPMWSSWLKSLLSHYLPKLPLKTLVFSLFSYTFLTLLFFPSIQKDLISVSPTFAFTFSLSATARETPSYLLSSTAHQETSVEEKNLWCTRLNRNIPTHFTLYFVLSSCPLFWRSHTSYCSHLFPSFPHWAPYAADTHSALLPTFLLLPHSKTQDTPSL